MSRIELFLGDCLEVLPRIETGGIDAILTDLPYGTTACSWDEVIPFEPMWLQVNRLCDGVFVTTATQPFASKLIMSNLRQFKYEWIWEKSHSANFTVAKYQPLKRHESICVFAKNGHTYNPQITIGKIKGNRSGAVESERKRESFLGSPKNLSIVKNNTYQPISILSFGSGARSQSVHPTQKPVSLYEYLVLTYTNQGDTVLDLCMGSGTTGVACVRTGRDFIGIEIKEDYYNISKQRIEKAQMQIELGI